MTTGLRAGIAAAICCILPGLVGQVAEFAALPAGVVLPPAPSVSVSAAGDYLVDGQPRYLFGVQIGSALGVDFGPTAGYPPELKWVYEEPMTYETAQRLGFDSFAWFLPSGPWLDRFGVEEHRWGRSEKDQEMLGVVVNNGLPLLVDYTCFPWSFGKPGTSKAYAGILPEEAINRHHSAAGNHWVPYNIFHPEGRKMYLSFWEYGVDHARQLGKNQKLVYELFNEPSYFDPSPYNRHLFAEYLERKYGSIEKLNALWRSEFASFAALSQFADRKDHPGIVIDWSKFCEEGMTALARDGRDCIRAKAAGARVCYQILGYTSYRSPAATNINIYEINRHLDAISTPTGGGLGTRSTFTAPPAQTVQAPANVPALPEGILQRHFFRCIADGKPIHNPECYAARSRNSNRNIVWQDLLRGSNATYMFTWSKRAWEWGPDRDEAGGRKIAERFPYILANPYAFSIDDLQGFMDAKQDIARFADFFVPRERGIAREVALLMSFATERYAFADGYVVHNEMLHYTSGLEYSHLPQDVVLEEQLAEGRLEQKSYRAVVAVGVRNVLPGTAAALQRYVANGGVLIAAREFMPWDEYGNATANPLFAGLETAEVADAAISELVFTALDQPALLPGKIPARNSLRVLRADGWETLATCDGQPAVLRRALGAGAIYAITPMLQDYAAAAVATALLARHDIRPALSIARVPAGDLAPNIEAHCARRDGMTLASLLNIDLYPKCVDITLPAGCATAADLLSNELLPITAGRARLMIGNNRHCVVGFATSADLLAQRFGAMTTVSRDAVTARYDEAVKAHERALAEQIASAGVFHIDPTHTSPVDLRAHANAAFVDQIANDGQGGWIDQGKDQSLDHTPWEITPLLGVPCDFIRFDANDNRCCIILASTSVKRNDPAESRGIPIKDRCRALFFFHTTANAQPGDPVMTYRVHYLDGGSVDAPIICGHNIDLWTLPEPPATADFHPAWRNSAGRGFQVFAWRNPDPNCGISHVDIISAGGAAVPIIIGITAEKLAPGMNELSLAGIAPLSWGCDAVVVNGITEVVVSEKSSNWAGVRFPLPAPLELTAEQARKAVIKYEVNGGRDPFGNYKGGQALQISIGKGFVHSHMRPDSHEETFEAASEPLYRWLPKNDQSAGLSLSSLAFQFRGTGKSSGVFLKNIRIEYPAE
ncbi:alpha-amylase family protein [Oligosphaera ethanolica]|uniref:Glycoside hydrolase family 42 N-terminal domain-containing protein n=1 Tax=Oligosphaera ethanolica TaxID=760260 RepID=A0AAE3VFI0_9BACT|nr:alpha-amylase family protein [Oligosphaera ethanolica]MDQ0289547.1 hypothetical protein [Oligosphaera ethanolica]